MEIKIASAQTDNPQDLTQLQINALRDKLGLYSYLKVVDMVEGDRPEDRYNTQPTFFLADPGQTLLKFVVFDAVTYLPKYVDLYKLITAGNLVPGDFGSNGQQIFNTNLEYINRRSITQADVGGAAVVVDFGDLGSTSVVAHINTLEPGLELVATQTNLTIIKAIVDNTAVSYLYNGVLATYGASATEFVESMLEPLEIEAQLLESGELLLDESTGGFYLKYQNRDIFEPLGFGALDLQGRWDENVQAGAAGTYAIATGLDNYVSGYAAAVFGYLNRVLGNYSVAFGSRNNANGSSHAFIAGNLNTAEGENNVIFGQRNVTNGDVAFTAGTDNEVNGSFSSAIGGYLRTDDAYEVAVGYGNFHILREDPGANDTREGDVIFHVGVGYQRSAPLSQLICYRGGLIRLTPIDLLNAEWNQNTPGGITGMWGIDSADGNKMKYHNGTEWVTVGNSNQISSDLSLKLDKGGYAGTAQDIVNLFSSVYTVVTENGAVGDGVTDDRVALQTIINNANPGDKIYFLGGVYLLTETPSESYCLIVNKSNIDLIFSKNATLLLADNQSQSPSLIQIGNASQVITNVNIYGGVIDGNYNNNTAGSIFRKAIFYDGVVKNCLIEDVEIKNHRNGAVMIQGINTSNRADNITANRLYIHDVAEGFEFTWANNIKFYNGVIDNMLDQDGFEAASGTLNWILKDSVVSRAASDNSAIDVFPRDADSVGIIDNCVIPGQVRMSIGSGTDSNNGTSSVIIRGCDMSNGGNIVGNISGKVKSVIIENNILVGPPSTGNIYRFNGIEISASEKCIITGNSISFYLRNGINCGNNSIIKNNKIFNNGQELLGASSSTGVVPGLNCVIDSNHFFDDQSSKTQAWHVQVGQGDGSTITNNIFGDSAWNVPLRYGTNNFTDVDGPAVNANDYIAGNKGIKNYQRFIMTIGAGSDRARVYRANSGGSLIVREQDAIVMANITPIDDMAPATTIFRQRNVSNAMDLRTNAAVANNTRFLVEIDNTGGG